MCRLSRNLEASTFWSTKGLSRPVMGLLYLLPRVKPVYNGTASHQNFSVIGIFPLIDVFEFKLKILEPVNVFR
jgi:hypothetical protein